MELHRAKLQRQGLAVKSYGKEWRDSAKELNSKEWQRFAKELNSIAMGKTISIKNSKKKGKRKND